MSTSSSPQLRTLGDLQETMDAEPEWMALSPKTYSMIYSTDLRKSKLSLSDCICYHQGTGTIKHPKPPNKSFGPTYRNILHRFDCSNDQ